MTSRVPIIVKSLSGFEFPVLGGAGFAKFVEGAGTDQGFHFFVEGLDAGDKIMEGGEGGAGAFAENGSFGVEGEAFDVG